VVQQHCHQHAILGYDHDRQLLVDAGVDTDVLDTGCCGLAGNFGFEKGHYDVSVACDEDKLMPALRDADSDALVLADGFSCRTQIRALASDRGSTGPRSATGGLIRVSVVRAAQIVDK
jgi:Fe-S oxidoreductase